MSGDGVHTSDVSSGNGVLPASQSASMSHKKIECKLPGKWKTTLPAEDQQWVATLFKENAKGGLDLTTRSLWNYPPEASLEVSRPPEPDLFFAKPLLIWMPYKCWKMDLKCICGHHLAGAGIYPKTKQVLDIDGFYAIATENVICNKCGKKFLSWGSVVLDQLDAGHRSLFPVVHTHK